MLAFLVLALVAPFGPGVASAGDGFWSPSGCANGRYAAEGDWYGVPGQGAWYRSVHFGMTPYWVGSGWYWWYQGLGWECGALGWPSSNAYDVSSRSPLYRPGEWLRQDFQNGGSLNYYYGRWIMCTRWECFYLA